MRLANWAQTNRQCCLKPLKKKPFIRLAAIARVSSDFQLIAGTVRDLRQLVAEGKFREDLYARINLWTFTLPGLSQRQEDIEPNLDYEVERHASLTGDSVRFNTEARRAWLAFATSPQQHGAVTFANFLPASRGWPPLPLADASLWTWWKMR
ncbi:sigma 54-interacting transcriptional regulator [Escherichia coli]